MKKTFILATLLLLSSAAMWAAPVSPEAARRAAEAFWSRKSPDGAALVDVTDSTEFTLVRLFAAEDGHGFVIVAADDCSKPILGYSLTNTLSAKQMPAPAKSWLDEYQNEILFYKDQNREQSRVVGRLWAELEHPELRAQREPGDSVVVGPLVTQRWDQGYPYNMQCPGGSVTGCVATAGAMIMRYHRWPNTGTGDHHYVAGTYGRQEVDFSKATYQWNSMPNVLNSSSSSTQKTAVSQLMYHIGVAVEMNYSPSSSGAQAVGSYGEACMLNAYRDYFRFKQTVSAIDKDYYDDDTWISMLKGELDAGRPMQYNGCDRQGQGCHSFICDGYDDEDYFHINWGWGGFMDAFFAIGALDPAQSGTGGNSDSSYDRRNQVIWHIEPDDPDAVDDVRGDLYQVYTEGRDAIVAIGDLMQQVEIYDVRGIKIYGGVQYEPEARYNISMAGVYIVVINGEAHKIAVN